MGNCQSRSKIVPITQAYAVVPNFSNIPVTVNLNKYHNKINNEKERKKNIVTSSEIYMQHPLPFIGQPEE